MDQITICRLAQSRQEGILITNILSRISNSLSTDTISIVCGYLLLLCDHIKFDVNVCGFAMDHNQLCIYLEAYRKYYSLTEQKILFVNYSLGTVVHSNWSANDKNHRYVKDNPEEIIYLENYSPAIIIRKKNKELQQEVFTCSKYPHQVFVFKRRKKNVRVFYSASDFYLYSFDHEKKEYKLAIKVKCWESWCIWKNFILYTEYSTGTLCSFDILTGDINPFLFQSELISPVKILLSWKNYIYVGDERNNVFIYK